MSNFRVYGVKSGDALSISRNMIKGYEKKIKLGKYLYSDGVYLSTVENDYKKKFRITKVQTFFDRFKLATKEFIKIMKTIIVQVSYVDIESD